MQKLYCYVDETGQDVGSEFFIVVAIVNDKEQDFLRHQLLQIEYLTKIGKRKWHKTKSEIRINYLKLILDKKNRQRRNILWIFQKTFALFFTSFRNNRKSNKI